MLKSIELVGFKSFADRTRFEFPDGITVVVGPNGSGKSNVVDAIKWTLGEQSAKSLRGKEMADVIFKGSGNGIRKPANTAEATIFFDNSDGRLPIESAEVSVTRRVYRSGEGEYLINGQPCRMRDVKDVFRGTGVGADAYSLIEQGKVDTLLQASPRDRRAIFEEAAGISRFKAKKIECQRRLDRVDQNLIRLSDIVEEVSGRLRSLKSQAAKAQRYREFTNRLKQLRTNVGLADWRKLTGQIDELAAEIQQIEARKTQLDADLVSAETEVVQLDRQQQTLTQQLQHCDQQLADQRAETVRQESTVAHQRARVSECEEEAARCRIELTVVTAKAGNAESQLQETQAELAHAEREFQQIDDRHRAQELDFETAAKELETLRESAEHCRQELAAEERNGVGFENKLSSLQSDLAALDVRIERGEGKRAELQKLSVDVGTRVTMFAQQQAEIGEKQRKLQAEHDQLEHQLAAGREAVDALKDVLADLQNKQTAAQERASMLDELERRLEGIGTGVKEILARSKQDSAGPFCEVLGMVADLLEVEMEQAPLIDVALGPIAKQIVVDGESLFKAVASGTYKPGGRVRLVQLKQVTVIRSDHRELAVEAGVIGQATRFVRVDARYESLLQRLLGTTWIVETIRDALRLRSKGWLDARFVSKAGELLDTDGSITIGPRHTSAGLLSRRTELREIRAKIRSQLDDIRQHSRRLDEARQSIKESESALKRISLRQNDVGAERSDLAAQMLAAQQRGQHLDQLHREIERELGELQLERSDLADGRDRVAESLENSLASAHTIQTRFDAYQQALGDLHRKNQVKSRQLTATKVELAGSDQRRTTLRAQLRRFQQDHQDRDKTLSQAKRQLGVLLERATESQREILRLTSLVAEGYLLQERHQRSRKTLLSNQAAVQTLRGKTATELTEVRRQLQQVEGDRHRRELQVDHVRQERANLESRLWDDYQIELSAITMDAASEEERQERDEIDREISQLRRKISNIGAVNMEALTELEDLESRYGELSTQYEDLIKSKDSLTKIIQRINGDSRRLFAETLEQIRANFQLLFRRVFGGGSADIILEADVDILDAGIDIVATPPGKHSLGISLLSGGERALTAVTLLLAIFQFRPSPFCVLDEVDGPLDEANIGRFIDVLNEFLKWTKFVVVTHSKTTMTCANTLYGVTMQESGVSKRVSVKFDDVGEDGHIRKEAVERMQSNGGSDDDGERGAA